MNLPSSVELTQKIVEKSKSLGATVAGVADIESLKTSPSHRIYPKIGIDLETPWRDGKDKTEFEEIAWPADAVSAVVIGVFHNANEPELDWWDGKGTPGNRILIRIIGKLSQWIEHAFPVKTYKRPYLIEKGGIFLKDAAAAAGLGCIGKNNLVITPGYGPRVRFRALLLDRKAEATGPLEFNPCRHCKQPCRKACPAKVFQHPVYSADVLNQSRLPGINGTYDRVTCNGKMEKDIEDAVLAVQVDGTGHQGVRQAIAKFEESVMVKSDVHEKPHCCVKYCRECELACPVGKKVSGR